jgi:hypothetical protein
MENGSRKKVLEEYLFDQEWTVTSLRTLYRGTFYFLNPLKKQKEKKIINK